MYLYLILFAFYFTGILSANIPCSIEDTSCLMTAAQEAYIKMIPANPELGLNSLDPCFADSIDGDLSILKFKLFDTTIHGLKDCSMQNIKISQDKTHLNLDLICPALQMNGKYDISGRLIVLPVEGNGDYDINTKKYHISVDADVNLKPGDDGKTYASIKNFKLNAVPLEGVVYDFRNLFNGQKDLAETVLKYANENWKEVADFVQTPVFNTIFKKVIKTTNKYLKTIPVESFLI